MSHFHPPFNYWPPTIGGRSLTCFSPRRRAHIPPQGTPFARLCCPMYFTLTEKGSPNWPRYLALISDANPGPRGPQRAV
jgi:hypothetical protein